MSKKNIIISLSIFLASLIGLFLPVSPAFAYDICSSDLPADIREANGCNGSTDQLPATVTNIINAVIGILATIAVIFVLIGGIQYMTSGGDSGKIKTAKNTILYALIGLVVCVLAFAIVNWLIGILKNS